MRKTFLHALTSGAVAAACSGAVFVTAANIRAADRTIGRASGQRIETAAERTAIEAFEQRISDYVALHRRVERSLPPLQVSHDMDTVWAAVAALAKRIQLARIGARQGDFFTPEVARVFRARIAACLAPEEVELVLKEGDEDDPTTVPPLAANSPWPAGAPFNFVPPALIAALPPLPPELQYRIIGRSVVLWDHHANLIVDYLAAAVTT
jgi:hypothetical protein